MHKIINVIEIVDRYNFKSFFSDGEIVSFDVRTLFEKYPVFEVLKDKKLFYNIKIDGVGYGVSWNDQLDLSSDGIYNQGKHIGKVEPDIRSIVGLAIAQAREEKGISQRQLSKNSGIMQAEICKIEQGKGNPTLITLQKIAKSLGKSLASLLM